jgi:hypothetical protein
MERIKFLVQAEFCLRFHTGIFACICRKSLHHDTFTGAAMASKDCTRISRSSTRISLTELVLVEMSVVCLFVNDILEAAIAGIGLSEA